MRIRRSLLLSIALVVSACAQQDAPTAPQLSVIPEKGKPQEIACRRAELKPDQNGKIKTNDCLFGVDQREDRYHVDALGLGMPDLGGGHMLTFSADAKFDGIFGVQKWDPVELNSLVYGYARFTGGNPNSFSLIGSDPEYAFYFSGADGTQTGKYRLTTTVEPSSNTCSTGRLVFLQGTVGFDGTINDDNACDGTVAVGPNVGNPLKFQYWYVKLDAGQSATLSIDGVDGSAQTVTLAVIRWGEDGPLNSWLDFSTSAGDTDRSITFTAPAFGYYYLEVSSLPGDGSDYHLSFSAD